MAEAVRRARVGVLGSGAWGLALARLFSNEGHDVVVWSESGQVVERLEATRTIPLPGDPELPAKIALTTSVEEAVAEKDVVVFVTSSRFVRSMAAAAAPYLRPDTVLVCATKGLEEGTFDTMTEVIAGEVARLRPDVEPVTVALSGPSHAEEVAFDMPTCIVAASHSEEAALLVQRLFSGDVLRVYTSADIHGVELCGAIKNVIALACGIARGLGFGDNSSAALITRGLAEMRRLGTRAAWALATTPPPRSSPAAWPRCAAWAPRWAATRRRSSAWPAPATWWSPPAASTAATCAAAGCSARACRSTRRWPRSAPLWRA